MKISMHGLIFIAVAFSPLLGCVSRPQLATADRIATAERTSRNQLQGNDAPYTPFNVIGNIYYVGTREFSSFLITTPQGHFLLDGGPPYAAVQIIANIRTLGFSIHDVRYLLNSHAHMDHAGGLAALQHASRASMVASAGDREYLEAGANIAIPGIDAALFPFPPIRVDRIVEESDELKLRGVSMIAHMTPGHTRGCTSWSMAVRSSDNKQHRAFFHCSSSVAHHMLVPELYPGIISDFRSTFANVRRINADVFLACHSQFRHFHRNGMQRHIPIDQLRHVRGHP